MHQEKLNSGLSALTFFAHLQIAKVSEKKWRTLTEYGFSASGGNADEDGTPVIIHGHIHYLRVSQSQPSSVALAGHGSKL